MHISHYLTRVSNRTNAYVHMYIKSSANIPEKKLSPKKRKFALLNALMHTTCTCTTMATVLQNSFGIPNMTPPQYLQNGQYGMFKFYTPWI